MHNVYFSFNFLCVCILEDFCFLYNYMNFIPALHLYSHWSFFGCLSHQGFAGGGRMCWKLWGYCSRGNSTINTGSWLGAMHLMQRWWVLYLDTSLLLCFHVSTSFLDILSYGLCGLLEAFQGTLTLQASQAIDFFGFTSRVHIYVLGQNW